ncbi:hypothetical protein GLOTRDRAFT_31888 [Gloeophyllum trabeum ATCC 11539]|uniref:Uncharacterized protein n=1 Tax=Gloeophyllum trabeum (strain ATCC 11539 / FP-39264 / Madison 617) TaxID=670483 RepID=S7QK23_GLOTA|nr:uncharacterized protein GLOTRDRAFT_31888 [Gloeophyllum trabeum ATCC 11539]EPQ60076.1 hypothetical protein GLOTRDRAFT_31888 [Gloeophyllum trabeum ATCC 11539]
MVKPKAEVIEQFNDGVNMDAEELEQWVEGDKAKNAGTGVGLESGRKIADILKRNPDKDPEGYEDEDIGHMRKVTG